MLLRIGKNDLGRPISSLGITLVDGDLEQSCHEVLQNFQPLRTEKEAENGRHYIRQITPYRTEERRIEGVVLVFHDITDIKELSRRTEAREQQQATVARLGVMALSGQDINDLMAQTVRKVAHTLRVDYCKILHYDPEQKDFLLVAGSGWQEAGGESSNSR